MVASPHPDVRCIAVGAARAGGLVSVLIGAVLAGALPVLLTIGELARLRSSLEQIDRSTSLSRQVQAFLEQQLGRTLTQLTAVAVKLDAEERDRILLETDRRIAEFSSSAVFPRSGWTTSS